MNEINDNELKQQLDTYLRALVPLEECLKTPPISAIPIVSNEQQTEHSHRHHHSHRRTNGTRGKEFHLFRIRNSSFV
jgi:hypothetical protein